MFRSDGTGTIAIIGTVAGTIPTPQLASAQVESLSGHDSAAVWRLPLLNGKTVAQSRAGSAAATKRQQRNHCSRASMTRDRRQSGDARGAQSLEMGAFPRVWNPCSPNSREVDGPSSAGSSPVTHTTIRGGDHSVTATRQARWEGAEEATFSPFERPI